MQLGEKPKNAAVGRCSAASKVAITDAGEWSNPLRLLASSSSSTSPAKKESNPLACGVVNLDGQREIYWAMSDVPSSQAGNATFPPPAEAFAAGLKRAEEIGHRVVVDTPDPRLNALVAASTPSPTASSGKGSSPTPACAGACRSWAGGRCSAARSTAGMTASRRRPAPAWQGRSPNPIRRSPRPMRRPASVASRSTPASSARAASIFISRGTTTCRASSSTNSFMPALDRRPGTGEDAASGAGAAPGVHPRLLRSARHRSVRELRQYLAD